MIDKPEIVVQCRCVKVNIPDPPTPEHIEAIRRTLLAGLPVDMTDDGQAFKARWSKGCLVFDDGKRRPYRTVSACANAIAPYVAPESLP